MKSYAALAALVLATLRVLPAHAAEAQLDVRHEADAARRRFDWIVGNVQAQRFADAVRIAASGSLDSNESDADSPNTVLESETAMQIFNCVLTGTYGWTDDGGRRYVGVILRRRVSLLDRACGLAGEQRETIRLAGERDISQLFERIAEQRRRFVLATTESFDETELADAVRDVSRLRSLLNSGPFDDDSFFAKIAKISLTPAQLTRYERWCSRSSPAARRELPDLSGWFAARRWRRADANPNSPKPRG